MIKGRGGYNGEVRGGYNVGGGRGVIMWGEWYKCGGVSGGGYNVGGVRGDKGRGWGGGGNNTLNKFEKNRMKTINILTKFHKDWMKTVTSTVYTNKLLTDAHCGSHFHEDQTINVASRVKNAPHLCGHVFQVNISIFKLNQNAPPPGGHVFSSIWTIFILVRDINKTNVSTKFHDDWAKIVTSRVNTAPPTGGHLHEDFASNATSTVFTSFELSQGINGTSVLTKFHEDRTIKASRVFTRQNVDDARRTTDKKQSQRLIMSMLCSGELKRNMTARKINAVTKFQLTINVASRSFITKWAINMSSRVFTRLFFHFYEDLPTNAILGCSKGKC
ncbi:hypothetical protein DPMN_003019 [Dreissena polymorpha]|uniref:Uncharacterized protein n=1 Tax=Dreissena polymorpha TaxID=45954 RepID=A0A9D4RUE8_DREPO|nr:hypothetical protein DPMN_003019 [Dreissena polymorpha]